MCNAFSSYIIGYSVYCSAVITFGINALYGRQKSKDGAWIGPWDSSNAYDFIKYTVLKGYKIDSWEFGMHLESTLSIILLLYIVQVS